ncbi:hypothetical protein VTJ49DRAFT_3065 [Mycothermus thermophilus]|uniref:Uncharacterized protein n=1 Tax=Humicola insolens TaxID=85995 RepID=A0ABR3VN18_HUMIN
MPNTRFTIHYHSHKCPATSPHDGDDVPPNHPDLKLTPLSTLDRLRYSDSLLLGKSCAEPTCKYVLNPDTVLHNKSHEPIRTLGGKNLYPNRTTPRYMRCCRKLCRNAYTRGHGRGDDVVSFGGEGGMLNHNCAHTLIYQDMIRNYDIGQRLDGCECVMLNVYGEEVEMWGPKGRGMPVKGGPLDLDRRYWEMKEKAGK